MTERIAVSDESFCELRLNEWDARAFGYPVAEITCMQLGDPALLKRLEERLRELGAGLCIYRATAPERELKQALLEHGFYVAESSVELYISKPRWKTRPLFAVRSVTPADMSQVVQIATDDFHYSRYHEDPFVSLAHATRRYRGWVEDLAAKRQLLVVHDQANAVLGFFAYSVAGPDVTLVLAGMTSEKRGFGFYVFSTILHHLASVGSTISARVSVQNVAMMNVYTRLGFTIRSAALDFHKLLAAGAAAR